MPTVDPQVQVRVGQAWSEAQEAPDLLYERWVDFVLTDVLGWRSEHRVPQGPSRAGFRPDFALRGPEDRGRTERLLFYRLPWGSYLSSTSIDRPSPVEEAAAQCRERGVPLALLCDSRQWVLVHARPGEPTSFGAFDSDLWSEEPLLFQAFAALLAAGRLRLPATTKDGSAPSDSTAALFTRTAERQSELTDELGEQVRQAVELLVGEIARQDRAAGGTLLADVDGRDVYRGVVTTLMRVVFLLFAEAQRLMPVDDLYADHYSVTHLHTQLLEERSLHGEEVGDRRAAAWPRLLALFAGVYHGVEHPDLRIPAYGGSLFEQSRYPWLRMFAVTDRVVFAILDALLRLKPKRREGTPTRISYKGLVVEDIGRVYEGLLEFSCLRTDEPHVGLRGKLEPELALRDLESRAAQGQEEFVSWLVARTGATRLQVERMLADRPAPRELAALDAACGSDASLTDRTAPFWGLLRTDLREEPTVFPAHSLMFTKVGERRATGTHYTPRPLADEIVRHTLDPLVHAPGPAEGAEEEHWRIKPAEELLKLTVCDPAMGSGAMLVSATRYLAERVCDAWRRDGFPDHVSQSLGGGYASEDVLLLAKRQVAASCIYGVDRDDLAVELGKLSLWLETLSKSRPLTFLDHALRCGDSLVGLVSAEQVRAFHIDPAEGRKHNLRFGGNVEERIDAALAESSVLRARIAAMPQCDDPEDTERKSVLLRRAQESSDRLRLACDAVVAAALGAGASAGGNWHESHQSLLTELSVGVQCLLGEGFDSAEAEAAFRSRVHGLLRRSDGSVIRPLHWVLEFPEVFGAERFSALASNLPFSGGQRLTGTLERWFREFLVEVTAKGRRGSADLCSYFLLRGVELTLQGRTGLITTNTIAQGDTREVGLDQVVEKGWNIYRARKSQPWPGGANVHVSLVWTGHQSERERPVLEDTEVRGVTPSLDARSRVSGNPKRLAANSGRSFIGSYVLGEGFVLEPEQARELIRRNPRNREVLFPYLIGKDLNSRPDCSPSRWVINFGAMTEEEAREYPEPFEIVECKVKPVRERNNRKVYRDHWWQYGEKRPAMTEAISGLDRVLAITLVSRTVMPVLVPSDHVFAHKLAVFTASDTASLALLSSSAHVNWAWAWSSTMKADLNYSPSDVFETLPMPVPTALMDEVGERLDRERREIMQRRGLGLTKLYNLVHSPLGEGGADTDRLREIHVKIDEAVMDAYGWSDLDLKHAHHETLQGVRWTVAPDARVEILDRLLELNLARHEEEVLRGVQPQRGRRRGSASAPAPGRAQEGVLF
ncbi:type IIL restriction-modification enzyme MmeI [Nocardiopsis sp. SBT366]|uniref:type IIL restriction-modification enzyme MmeI n=1 Tax=Nocardiopsis sp. SBT366 TaxID=1580529 RepID=UPI0009E1B47D|nr:type IIL restriction-modification enzyme MmeI [Nocardiopsis sp. SBT366]